MRYRAALRLLVFLLLAMRVVAQQRIEIAGTVPAGQSYEKNIGQGLVFAIRPDDLGFSITIEPKALPGSGRMESDDFTRCVTPPFHGPNPTTLLAWQFVDENNERLPGAQLAPIETREFQFVTSFADQKKACDELEAVLYGPEKYGKNGELVLGTPGYKPPALGRGKFKITTFNLRDVGKGKQARFLSLTFEAYLELPLQESAARR